MNKLKQMKKLVGLSLLGLMSISCYAQLPKGDRILAWQVDMAQNANYDSAFAYAQTGCMESIHLFYTWSGLEPNAGNFDTSHVINALDISNIYYPAFGVKAELQIAPINTIAKETPADLVGTSFDSPTMINRFKALLDTLFTHIPQLELSALNIGNESDIFLGTNSAGYAAYKTFLDSVIPYAKQLYFNLHGTDLKVGTTFTFDGLVGASTSALCQSVNSGLDIVTVTYYPLNSNFTMESPSVVSSDFSNLVAIYSDTTQPIYFAECGYASSTVCNSSETLQAQFFSNVFSAWDAHYDNIKYLTIFKSTDWSQQEVDTLGAYYGITDTTFLEYLRTLGVRTWDNDGSNKPAYESILCFLQARGWCSVNCIGTDIEENHMGSKTSIYPNPATDMVNVVSEESITQIEVYNNTGELIFVARNKTIALDHLSKGIYHLNIQLESGKTEQQKLIKQ